MADSTVVVRGQVSSTTDRYTKNGRPFTIATLSLMDGGLDVFVWEEQRAATRGLWEPGKVVEIIGTVRVRDDDQITISCKEASEYVQHIRDEVEDVSMNGTSTPEPPPPASPIPEARVPQEQTRPAAPNGSAVVNGDRSLNVRIRETGRSTEDQVLLDDVLRLLMDHLGDNEVRLEIATEGKIVTLQWPTVRVDASPELEQRLIEVLGPSGTASVESASA